MLDERNEESYDTDEIRTYELEDGEYVVVRFENSWGYLIREHENEFRLSTSFLNGHGIIKWDEDDYDTVTVVTRVNDITITEIYFNDELVWNNSNGDFERYFEVIKE